MLVCPVRVCFVEFYAHSFFIFYMMIDYASYFFFGGLVCVFLAVNSFVFVLLLSMMYFVFVS